ncbi:heavy metal-binding domain-containing protein [Rubrolithibacter danxiaensis]|uniref:heavy metal-binding domain-containing protein n=1 Tax=Rubrolithibacter danxiaensis TaxID=3390805 RepID=UPI003BF829F5
MKTLIAALAASLTIAFSACNNATNSSVNQKTEDSAAVQKTAVTYTCPMHPEVISDKPGKCPKCGMNLVEKGSEISSTDSVHHVH